MYTPKYNLCKCCGEAIVLGDEKCESCRWVEEALLGETQFEEDRFSEKDQSDEW